MEVKYTKHQSARGAKADAEVNGKMYLIKNVSELRLTYQIKMLAFQAKSRGMKLIIKLPKGARADIHLKGFILDSSGLVKIERT